MDQNINADKKAWLQAEAARLRAMLPEFGVGQPALAQAYAYS